MTTSLNRLKRVIHAYAQYNDVMRDLLSSLDTWLQRGEQIAIATVTKTWGSAPRPPGAKMAVTLSGQMSGSVSAGCVEGAVIEEAMTVINSGVPRLLSYGVSDEAAFDVGLACGGTIEVFVEPFAAFEGLYDLIKTQIAARRTVGIVSLLNGPPEYSHRKLVVWADGRIEGASPLPGQPDLIAKTVVDMLSQESGGLVEIGGATLFIDVYPRVPRLIIVGAVHIAEILAPIAGLTGFEVYIVDPRSAFATRERFPQVTQIVHQWPDPALSSLNLDDASYVVVLTHDPKLDDPALQIALTGQAKYIGALGSNRTNQMRRERLRNAGLTEMQLARLHSPIGLPLGGRSPAEIAISIMAEIVQTRNRTSTKTNSVDLIPI